MSINKTAYYLFDQDFLKHMVMIEGLIHNNKLEESFDHIESTHIKDRRGKRYISHLKVKVHMAKLEYQACLILIKKIKNEYPEYIGINADLACVYFMMKDFLSWKQQVHILKDNFDAISSQLSSLPLQRSLILLGKFYEELGRINEALIFYNKVYKSINPLSKYYPFILAQMIRIKTQWGLLKKCDIYYKDLFLMNKEIYYNNFKIEVLHALFLAEGELFGIENSLKFFLECEKELSENDKQQFLFDLIELCLRKSKVFPKSLEEFISLKNIGSYEKSLYEIYKKKENCNFSIFDRDIPLCSSLILMSLILKNSSIQRPILKGQYMMLIQSFDIKTRKLWLNRIESKERIKNNIIRFNGESLNFKEKSINILKKKNILSILIQLGISQQQQQTLENIVLDIWDSQYNTSYFHRLRMSIKRFNQEVAQNFLIHDFLVINSESIKVNSRYELKICEMLT